MLWKPIKKFIDWSIDKEFKCRALRLQSMIWEHRSCQWRWSPTRTHSSPLFGTSNKFWRKKAFYWRMKWLFILIFKLYYSRHWNSRPLSVRPLRSIRTPLSTRNYIITIMSGGVQSHLIYGQTSLGSALNRTAIKSLNIFLFKKHLKVLKSLNKFEFIKINFHWISFCSMNQKHWNIETLKMHQY